MDGDIIFKNKETKEQWLINIYFSFCYSLKSQNMTQ